MDLMWKKDVQHGRAHIIKVECAYIPHAQISEFLNDEQSHEDSSMSGIFTSEYLHKKM
jgi:hypothetical protein